MARLRKKVKDYERWILIGVVVVILATISVSGVGPQSCGQSADADLSGSFLAAPGKRVEVSGDEFRAALHRYTKFFRAFGPSIRFGRLAAGNTRDQVEATWMHVAAVEAAKAAGYRVGEEELAGSIRAFVGERSSGGAAFGDPTLAFRPEVYDQMVAQRFGGTKPEFEQTFREVLLKDKLFAPLIDAVRLSKPSEQAFEAWKTSRERVDLAWVAVPAAQFEERARLQEETRSSIARHDGTLRRVAATAQRVRDAIAFVEGVWKPAHGGALPKDAAELTAKEEGRQPYELEKDLWDRPMSYEVRDGKPWFSSAGPDEKDPKDDVTPDALRQVETLASLRSVADALVQWHGAAKEYPASLDALKTAPPSATGARTVPPMSDVPSDAWGRPLVYEREGPVLLSTGADGERGTSDDLRAEVTPDRSSVPLPAALEPFLAAGGAATKDAWGRPFDVQMRGSSPWRFEVTSAGADGKPGTDDDVRTGNEGDLAAHFARERSKHRVEERRSIEAVWVLFPRVPDESFQAAWAKFPEYRPKEAQNDDQAYDRFRNLVDTYYHPYQQEDGRRVTGPDGKPVEADPADREKGHGVAALEAGAKAAWLVPAPETLGDRKDVEIRADDPLHKVYVERGWRRILLREQFFEAMLNDWLKRVRESEAAHEAWEKGDRKGPEPERVTFQTLLGSVAEFRPSSADEANGARFLEYVPPTAELSNAEVEKAAPAFDAQVTHTLGRLSKEGEYAAIPTVVRGGGADSGPGSTGRVILRNVKYVPPRDRTLEEVRADVWPGYLASKRADLADAELQRVREAAQPAPATPGATPPPPRPIEGAAAEVGKARGFTWTSGTTGFFVGAEESTPELRLPANATEEQKAALRAAHVVRESGYSTVRSGVAGAQGGLAAGTIGRTSIRDVGEGKTDAVYLVEVRRREDAPPEEFHGERYRDWLKVEAYAVGRDAAPPTDEKGWVRAQMTRFYGDYDAFRKAFDLKTAHPAPPSTPPTRPAPPAR